jgi:flavin reductase (DIM6/NTAB) family NADH-FMN oxidoreductase RutF
MSGSELQERIAYRSPSGLRSLPDAFAGHELRGALGAFPTGVTVITTGVEQAAYGMTANAFTSVSLDPPLVLVCVQRSAAGREEIERNGAFAVNILGENQEPVSRHFASRARPRGREAFGDLGTRTVGTGCPIIDGVAAYADCTLHAAHDAGDHVIFIGEVLAIGVDPGVPPLVFHGGQYRQLISPAG